MTVRSNMEGKSYMALRNHFINWSECDIAWPNEKYEVKADTPYIIVQPIGLFYDNEVITVNCGVEHRGTWNISVCVPFTWDYASHVGMAGRVCDFFPDGAYYQYEDVTVRILDRPRVIFAPRIDGPVNRLEAQINWRAWG